MSTKLTDYESYLLREAKTSVRRDQLETARAEITHLRALLAKVEWTPRPNSCDFEYRCPVCHSSQGHNGGYDVDLGREISWQDHQPDCELAAVLK